MISRALQFAFKKLLDFPDFIWTITGQDLEVSTVTLGAAAVA